MKKGLSKLLFFSFILSAFALGGGIGLRRHYNQELKEPRLIASKEDIRLFTDVQYKDPMYLYEQRDNSRDFAVGGGLTLLSSFLAYRLIGKEEV